MLRSMNPTKEPSMTCGICASDKHSVGYVDSESAKKHYVLVCPKCDDVPNWPRSRR